MAEEEEERKWVLVVGGSGYLGQHLLAALASAAGCLDVAFTHHSQAPPQPLLDALPSVRADLRSGDGFETIAASFGQKDHERFRAKCVRADKGCNWTFFASTSKKIYIGCKVKKNGPTHNCGSVNNCGDTMATNNWVAERVVDWLKEDPKKGPKELQAALKKRCPDAIAYLDENHPYLWSRSKFSDHCKVDYINNNLSESFNNWVKVKDLQIVEMHDNIRRMIIAKFELRSKIAESIEGKIIPSITKALTAQSKAIKDCEVLRCGHGTTEVNAPTKSGVLFRYAANLELKTCSCRAWQVSGKPCRHALAFIAKLSREIHMDDYVHEYFSVAKFKKTYSSVFNPMTSKQFWPRVDPGYKIKKPILRRKPGRPRKSRIKASDESGSTKQKRCPECHELGHTTKKCQGGLTARQKRSRLSSDNVLEEGSNDPSATLPSSSRHIGRGRGRATSASTSHIEGEAPPTGRGRERGRGRGRGVSRLAAYFNA